MHHTARQTRDNRTLTVDCWSEAAYFQLLGDRQAFLAGVLAFVMALGVPRQHQATGSCWA